jgi:hypothetical protein
MADQKAKFSEPTFLGFVSQVGDLIAHLRDSHLVIFAVLRFYEKGDLSSEEAIKRIRSQIDKADKIFEDLKRMAINLFFSFSMPSRAD